MQIAELEVPIGASELKTDVKVMGIVTTLFFS